MPSVIHQSCSPNAMTSSFNVTQKPYQNATSFEGLFQSKDITLVHHIEALKSAANSPLIFPNVNNSSRQNSALLSISKCGESTDISSLRQRPFSSSWAIDHASVSVNLKRGYSKDEKREKTPLTIEEILSRGSSVSEKAVENTEEIVPTKSKVKSRRKSKSLRRKSEVSLHGQESNVSRSSPYNNHRGPTGGNNLVRKSIDGNNLDSLTALCRGITIQEKSQNSFNCKISPSIKKSIPTGSPHQSNSKSISKGSGLLSTKKINGNLKHPLNNHRRKLGPSKCEDVKAVKVFQSDQQSGIISDLGMAVPCAPPATPTADQLRHVEYVPSLQDVRAQRAFRQRLQLMESRAAQKESRKQESLAINERLSNKEKKMQFKKYQRQQIYALNKVMTEHENERFQTFMAGRGF